MSFKDISDKLEKKLEKQLGCTFSYLLMRVKNDNWIVEAKDTNRNSIKSKFYEARNLYGPKSILEIIPFPNVHISSLNDKSISSKSEIKKLELIKEQSEQVVDCEDESCFAYQLENNNEWLIKFIEKYIKNEK